MVAEFLKRIFSYKNRRHERMDTEDFHHLKLSILGTKMTVHNYSQNGFLLKNDSGPLHLQLHKSYQAEIFYYGIPKGSVQLKVVRVDRQGAACVLTEGSEFHQLLEFIQNSRQKFPT